MIAIVDYGAGNLRSVELALSRLREETAVTREPDMLERADGIILPGVGAFADAMEALEKSGVVPALREQAARGKPLLGICLGMQMMNTYFLVAEEARACPGWGSSRGRCAACPTAG